MKKTILVLTMFLTACATSVPVKQKFPEVPQRLMAKCPNLETVPEDTTSLADLLKVVVKNYSTYYQCAVVTDSWQEWYQVQKIISEEANK
jgi:hypothetical protein